MARTSPASKAKTFEELPEDYRMCIDEYIMHGNMTRSYELVKSEITNRKSMAVTALNFFRRKNIQEIIEARKQQLASVGSMGAIEVIKQIEEIAKGNSKDQFSDVTSNKDKLEALKLLAKILGIADDRTVVNNNIQQVFVDDVKE